MSLDYKLFFAWHVSMMILLVASPKLGPRNELMIAAALAFVFVNASMRRRQQKDWHWRGAELKHRLMAVGQTALIGFFFFSISASIPRSSPIFIPISLIGGGMCLFNVLAMLRLSYMSEEAFLKDCGPIIPEIPQPEAPLDPSWKRAVRAVYSIVFVLCWLAGVGSGYLHGEAEKSGSPSPTAERTERLDDQGKAVYVLPAEKRLYEELKLVFGTGVPLVLVAALLIHFGLKVQLFPETPTDVKGFREALRSANKK